MARAYYEEKSINRKILRTCNSAILTNYRLRRNVIHCLLKKIQEQMKPAGCMKFICASRSTVKQFFVCLKGCGTGFSFCDSDSHLP